MATPQQPELRRSGDNALVPGDPVDEVTSRSKPRTGGETGPVPEENLPGHHPDDEQDKPDAEDFVAKAKEVAAKRRTAPSSPGVAAKTPAASEKEARHGAPASRPPIATPPPAPGAAATPWPDPSGERANANPIVTIARFQWKVATFPIRVASGAISRVRRLL